MFGAGVIKAGNPYYIQPPSLIGTALQGAPETVYANSNVFGAGGAIDNVFRAQSAICLLYTSRCV